MENNEQKIKKLIDFFQTNDDKSIKQMIDEDISIVYKDFKGIPILVLFAMYNAIDLLKYVIKDKGVKLSEIDMSPSYGDNEKEQNQTFLNAFLRNIKQYENEIQKQYVEVLNLLVKDGGLDINAEGNYNETPLSIQIHYSNEEMVKAIIELGGKKKIKYKGEYIAANLFAEKEFHLEINKIMKERYGKVIDIINTTKEKSNNVREELKTSIDEPKDRLSKREKIIRKIRKRYNKKNNILEKKKKEKRKIK